MTRYKLSPAQMGKLDVVKTLAKKNLGRVTLDHSTDETSTTITAATNNHSPIVICRTLDPLDPDQLASLIDVMRDYLLSPIIVPMERKKK